MALYGTYLDLSVLSTIREEKNYVEFPVSQSTLLAPTLWGQ